MIAYHKKALEDVQNGRKYFEVVVSLVALKTSGIQPANPVSEPERQPRVPAVINPPLPSSEEDHDGPGDVSDNESEHELDIQEEDLENENFPEYSGYVQDATIL